MTQHRLWILSDLHTDRTAFSLPTNPGADILIIAGDIGGRLSGKGRLWLERHLPRDIPCIIAPGNHDFYGADILDEIEEFRSKTDLTNVEILDGTSREINGIRFAGGTLWTDYEAYTDSRTAQDEALHHMNDFDCIHWRGRRGRIRPHHFATIHERHLAAISGILSTPFDGPTCVVTHHAPSPRSLLHGRALEPLDASYASDLEALIRERGPDLWIHGHIHRPLDYAIGGTRIIANPRGYFDRRGSGRNASTDIENPRFDPALIIDLDDERPLATGVNIDIAIDRPDAFQWSFGRSPAQPEIDLAALTEDDIAEIEAMPTEEDEPEIDLGGNR